MQLMVIGGKATKRSRFGFNVDDQIKGTFEAARLVSAAGLKIHVIDSEWRMNDVLPSELESLLNLFPEVKTLLTLAAKRRDVDQLLRLYLPIVEDFGNAGLCIVTGNRVYLESDEVSADPYESVKRVLSQVYGRVTRILLGVEGLEKYIDDIIHSYPGLKLFFLYDEGRLKAIEEYVRRGVESAVYVPYAIDKPLSDVVWALADYVLRRKWLREELKRQGYSLHSRAYLREAQPKSMEALTNAVLRLSICGSKEVVVEKMRKLKKSGVSMIVGLPVYEEPEQVHKFSECLRSL